MIANIAEAGVQMRRHIPRGFRNVVAVVEQDK
jgi:hypothetical protein